MIFCKLMATLFGILFFVSIAFFALEVLTVALAGAPLMAVGLVFFMVINFVGE